MSGRSYIDDAVISSNGLYRYQLTRRLMENPWADGLPPFNDRDHLIAWVMLNPSTANEKLNDPTVRKVMAFSKQWGYRVVDIYNLFGFRTAYPRDLWFAQDPVGPDNDIFLKQIPYNVAVVAAWGDSMGSARFDSFGAKYLERVDAVKKMLSARRAVCLGRTKTGGPRHPARIAYSTQLEAFA